MKHNEEKITYNRGPAERAEDRREVYEKQEAERIAKSEARAKERHAELEEVYGTAQPGDKLSPSEAVFGFLGWLTTREAPVTFSKVDDSGLAAKLASEFCKINDLDAPRNNWTINLHLPACVYSPDPELMGGVGNDAFASLDAQSAGRQTNTTTSSPEDAQAKPTDSVSKPEESTDALGESLDTPSNHINENSSDSGNLQEDPESLSYEAEGSEDSDLVNDGVTNSPDESVKNSTSAPLESPEAPSSSHSSETSEDTQSDDIDEADSDVDSEKAQG